jgi:PAS domain S-box-containing protein
VTPPRERFASGTLVVRDRRIVYASEGVGQLTGRAVSDLIGRTATEFIVEEDRARVAERHERRVRGEPVPSEYETTLLLPDGARRPVELHVGLDGGDIVVHLRDVTAQVARRPRLEALAALGAAIQQERTEEAVLARLKEGLPPLALAGLLNHAEPDGVRVAWAGVPPELEAAFSDRLGRPVVGYVGRWSAFSRAAWSEGAAYSDDWGAEAAAFLPEGLGVAARGVAVALGVSRAVAVRLDERDGLRFYLVLAGGWLRTEDVPAVRLFGAQVAAALDAARTIADLSRRNADLSALNRIAELAGDASDLDTFFSQTDALLREAVGLAGIVVFLLDEGERALVRVYDDGTAPAALRARFARVRLSGALGDVVRERATRVIAVADAPEGRDELAPLPFATAVWVPLVARSKVVGVMAAGFDAPPDLAGGRLELLAAAGAHLAGAIESHGLLADLRRRVSELTLLNDVALASTQLDPVLLLDNALRRVCETFEADVAAAYLREGDRLSLVRGVGISEETARRWAKISVGEALPGLAVQRLAPVQGTLADFDPASAAVAASESLHSAVAVPLLAKGRASVGAVVFGRRTPRATSEGELTLLSAVGVQLGVAVENARLFADVRRRLSDLEAVHALALRIFGNAPGDVKGLLEDGCREAARAVRCRAAILLLVSGEGEAARLRGVAGWGAPLDPTRIEVPLARDQLSADAIRRRAPAWSEDVTRDPRSAMYGNPNVPPLAMMVVPLTSREATRGVLFLADDAGRTFTEAELALANALAGELAVGVENAELYAEARRRVEELSLLNEMGRTVAGSLDLDHVLSAGVEAARRLLGATRGVVLLYDPVRGDLRVGAMSDSGAEAHADSAAILRQGGVSWRAIHERRVIVVEDALADPQVNAHYKEQYQPRSLVAAPLLLRGEPLGVLLVMESERTRRFGDAEVERVSAVANQLAVALENARLYAEARGRLSELSTVIDVARVVSSSLELEEVLAAGAQHLRQTLGGSACTILLDDVRRAELRRAASSGAPIGPASVPLAAPSLARDALAARAPLTGADSREGAPARPGDPALLAVPLHVRDQPVGVALVAAGDPGRTFTPGELSRAMAIASQLAVAVDNARLYSETRRRAEELGLLHEVGRSLVATLDIEGVLDAGVRNLARMVDAPVAHLTLLTDDGAELEVRAVWGPSGVVVGSRSPARGGPARLANLVLERREPIAVDDALGDPRVRDDLAHEPSARSLLGLPLLVRDRFIGAAVIVETRGPRRFSAAEVERAAAIANQLAVAAENARLYEDLRRSYAELAHAQRQLIQQERLAALGELSAIVAHEVRNPLGVIFNSLGSLRRLIRPQGDAKMLLDIVGEEADRLNRIVGDLLDFARPSTPLVRPEPLARVVEEAVAAALAQNPTSVVVERVLEELPLVPMDARLVRQAVLNVAVNAVQAMPRGGTLTVRTLREDGAALLELEDTGPGIAEEVRNRIFEPFFTTKASGTGLGLAVVKRIVEGHGGEISVRSRPGEGTTFSLRFPLTPPPGVAGEVEIEAENG